MGTLDATESLVPVGVSSSIPIQVPSPKRVSPTYRIVPGVSPTLAHMPLHSGPISKGVGTVFFFLYAT